MFLNLFSNAFYAATKREGQPDRDRAVPGRQRVAVADLGYLHPTSSLP